MILLYSQDWGLLTENSAISSTFANIYIILGTILQQVSVLY